MCMSPRKGDGISCPSPVYKAQPMLTIISVIFLIGVGGIIFFNATRNKQKLVP